MTTERTIAPYGSWRSPISVDHVVGKSILLGEPWLDGDDLYWLEGRPSEGGRRALVRREPDGPTTQLTPAPNVSHVKSALAIRCSKHEPGVPIDLEEKPAARRRA